MRTASLKFSCLAVVLSFAGLDAALAQAPAAAPPWGPGGGTVDPKDPNLWHNPKDGPAGSDYVWDAKICRWTYKNAGKDKLGNHKAGDLEGQGAPTGAKFNPNSLDQATNAATGQTFTWDPDKPPPANPNGAPVPGSGKGWVDDKTKTPLCTPPAAAAPAPGGGGAKAAPGGTGTGGTDTGGIKAGPGGTDAGGSGPGGRANRATPRIPGFELEISPEAVIPIQNNRISIGGSQSGTASVKNGDAVPMLGLDVGVFYRTDWGFRVGGGALIAASPGDQFSASGMTTGGFNFDIKSNISGPIIAPYVGIGTHIPHAGSVFFQSGIWLQQNRETVKLSQGQSFTETFMQDQDEARPFVGLGYETSLCIGNIGNIGNIGDAGLGRMKLRANAMYIFSGSNQMIPGGNSFSFANFQQKGNFAVSAGVGFEFPSDIRLKRDVTLLSRLASGLGLYRYRYIGVDQEYVGVMAQEVRLLAPAAVSRAPDGYLQVNYARLGMRLMTWEEWSRGQARPSTD